MAKVEYRTGNILDDNADAVVIPVNCVGVMGKGLALQFAFLYPAAKITYEAHCASGDLKPGSVTSAPIGNVFNDLQQVALFFPTKRHWREGSRYCDLTMSLGYLARYLQNILSGRSSIAIPALGCGLGGLGWQDVEPLLLQFASLLPETFTVRLYAPQGPKEPA